MDINNPIAEMMTLLDEHEENMPEGTRLALCSKLLECAEDQANRIVEQNIETNLQENHIVALQNQVISLQEESVILRERSVKLNEEIVTLNEEAATQNNKLDARHSAWLEESKKNMILEENMDNLKRIVSRFIKECEGGSWRRSY